MRISSISLRRLIMIVLTAVFLVSSALFIVFDAKMLDRHTEKVVAEEARAIAYEMDAMWRFMDQSQDLINYSADGTYDFKGLHCSIVGKSVGSIFSKNNDCTITYTNFNPRNSADRPDAFETEALEAFKENPELTEYYEVVEVAEKGTNVAKMEELDSRRQFRYAQALEVNESCLECHGNPVGELDITGHEKEGWDLDSMGGAISISIPMKEAYSLLINNVIRDAIFFLLLLTLIGGVMYVLMNHFIFRPMRELESAFTEVSTGNFENYVSKMNLTSEVTGMIENFNNMSRELKGMYDGLEDQVDARTKDIQAANEELRKQRDTLRVLGEKLQQESQLKSDMLSMVNHELRTPLTSIITIAETSVEASDDAEERTSWEAVRDNGKELLSLINNMLDIAKTEAGKMQVNIELLDMGDVVATAKSTLKPLADGARVTLQTSVAPNVPLVCGDYDKLQRVLENLGSNAVKFTPEGGLVLIKVERESETGDVLMSVIDEGIGIPEDKQEKIFERFYQVDSTATRSYRGSGLGLALVRDYMRIQGFTISVESMVGSGSTFTVRIPVSKTARID